MAEKLSGMASSDAAGQSGNSFRTGSQPDSLDTAHAARVLRDHLARCRELLTVIQRENRALQSAESIDLKEFADARKSLLPALSQAYKSIKEVSFIWQQLGSAERQRCVEVCSLIRQNQDVIMNVVLLDRENERLMTRRGMISAAPTSSEIRPRTHFVANLYRARGTPL